MYEAFYGLTLKPFQISPDGEFYFDAAPHRRAMDYLVYGLDRQEGFIVLTGDAGTGKTMLANRIVAGLKDGRAAAAMQAGFSLDAPDLLRAVASAFGNPVDACGIAETLLAAEVSLVSVAQQGRRCLLVVDDAQTLSAGAFEALRMLSNLQIGRYALLQVVLVGEPRLRGSVQAAGLRQRVICACHVDAFDAGDTRQYIGHRLSRAGLQGGLDIRDDAYDAIYAASNGVARRVNSLCDRVLLGSFLEDRRVICAADVNRVAAEYERELAGPPDALAPGS